MFNYLKVKRKKTTTEKFLKIKNQLNQCKIIISTVI